MGFRCFYQKNSKYLYTKATVDFGYFADPVTPTGVQFLFAVLSDYTNTYNTIAMFGFVDYKMTDKFTFSVGVRFDNDKITQENVFLEKNPLTTKNVLQPKASLAYQATDDVLVYVNYGKGYRAGGFNSDTTAFFNPEYLGETSDSYEIGLKTAFASNRVIINAAGFYTNFTNQQQYAVAFGTAGLLIGNYNLPKSTITGMEIDLKIRTSNYLDILSGFGYTKSRIEEGGTDGDGTFDRSSLKGNYTPFVPLTTFNIALQSAFPINKNIDFVGFLNLSNKGKIHWHEDNLDVSDPYNLLDGRLGISINKKYDITIWSNNITDTKYYQEYYAGEISGSAAGDIAWRGKPRTVGVDLTVKF